MADQDYVEGNLGLLQRMKDMGGFFARVVAVAGLGVTDNTGAAIYPDNYPQTLTYNGDGTVNTISFTDGTNTWTQTMTYTSGKVTGISAWVRS